MPLAKRRQEYYTSSAHRDERAAEKGLPDVTLTDTSTQSLIQRNAIGQTLRLGGH